METGERLSSEVCGPLSGEDFSRLLDSSYEAVVVYDRHFRFLYLNAVAERLMGGPAAKFVGVCLWDAFPERAAPFRETLIAAMTERIPLTFEAETNLPHRSVTEGRCVPISLEGHSHEPALAVFFRNITVARIAEERLSSAYEREVVLNRIGDLIRSASNPEEIQAETARALGMALGADRCYFNFFDPSQDRIRIDSDYHREGLPSIAGTYPLAHVQTLLLDDLFSNGATLAINDVRDSHLSPDTAQLLEEFGYRAIVTTPFFTDDHLTALLVVVMTHSPRAWNSDELTLVESVASQSRSGVEAARLLAELHARVRREELINRIAAAIRLSIDTAEIKATAVHLLGEALGADRCYVATYDLERNIVDVPVDFRRGDLPSIKGIHQFPNTAQMFHELYRETGASVICDAYNSELSAQTRANMQSLNLRSRVSVAVRETVTHMSTLTAAMSDMPRDWTADEIQLIEAVATLMRTTVETAQLRKRERRIATELQEALQPSVPDFVPGLQIGQFIKPALNEAAVGGDFFDVFPLDKELYAVVIGDVSGKGLAAAAQLATVRNMLRGFLYQYKEPVEAVKYLNSVLTGHQLLIGFVTAFVGVYDIALGRITYTSCGHEPVVLHRAATNTVDLLETTGPPLGVNEHADYVSENRRLAVDDTLILYTDGISEAGPTRKDLLGIDGLTRIIHGLHPLSNVDAAAEALVSAACDYANGTFRDDVCVLLVKRVS